MIAKAGSALRAALLVALALGLSGCVVYGPPVGYGYAPGYVYPAPVYGSVGFGFHGHWR